jgi:hypothetical protein
MLEHANTTGPAVHYYIQTGNRDFRTVVSWLHDRGVPLEVHLNRTRWHLDPDTKLHTEFCLRYASVCSIVDNDLDLVSGLPLDYSVEHQS